MASTYTVSNQSELLSTLGKASGGDTILLESGNYGNVDFQNLNFNSFVTVKSADADKPAVFNTVDIDNSSYLRIDGIHASNTSNGTSTSRIVAIDDSDHIEFLNSEVNGPVDSNYTGHYGIYANNNSDIVISGNNVHDVKVGLVMYPNQNLEVSENFIDHTGSDGMKFIGVNNFLIENNEHGGNFHPQPGAHLDFIQFQGSPSSDGVIRGNVFLAESHANVQGIFLADVAFDNILIEQNIIATGMINAIKVGSYGTNITARDNTVINIPDTVHTASKLIGAQSSSGNLITSTTTEQQGSNIQIDTDDYAQYFQGDIKLGLTLDDLRPVAGSTAENFGALGRLEELLDGTPFDGTQSAQVSAPTAEPEPALTPETEPEPAPTQVEPEAVDLGAVNALLYVSGDHKFASRGDVIEIAPSDALKVDAATISFTFNADTVSGMRGLVSKDASYYAGGGHHFTSYIKDGVLHVRLQDGSDSTTLKLGGIKTGQDYDVQVSFGGGEARLHVNGELVGSATTDSSWISNGEYLQIGANGWASDSGEAGYEGIFEGTISDVVIFDEVLTPDAVAALEDVLNGSPPIEPAPAPTPVEPAPTPVEPAPTPVEPAPTPVEPAPTPQSLSIETDELPAQSDIIKITGSADVIEVPPGALPDYAAAAVSFTFTADDPGRLQGLVSNDAAGYGNHFNIYLDNGMLNARFQTADGQEIVLTKSGIVAGQTYDVSVTTNGSEVGLNVNGSLAQSVQLSWSWADSDQYLQIGANGWASSDGAAGYSDVFIGTIQGFSFEPIEAVQPTASASEAPAEVPTLGGRLFAIFDKLYDSLSGNNGPEAVQGTTQAATVQTDEAAASAVDMYAALDNQANPELTMFDISTGGADEFVL